METATEENCDDPDLGDFFASKKRTRRLVQRSSAPARLCSLCGADVETDTAAFVEPWRQPMWSRASESLCEGLCEGCEFREAAWERVRCWVCLSRLLAEQRAFPLWPTRYPASLELQVRDSWEDEAEDELAGSTVLQCIAAAPEAAADVAWARLAAAVADLPVDLLARILEFASAGSIEVFAPRSYRLAQREEKDVPKRHCCTKRLLETGSCLHGRVVGGCSRRHQAAVFRCWYCPVTFPRTAQGAEDLEAHGDAEHAAEIQAWIRKARKVKARRHRQWHEANQGDARRLVQFEQRAWRSLHR